MRKLLLALLLSTSLADAVPLQIILALAPDEQSHRGELRRFFRVSPSSPWKQVDQPAPVLFGRNGLAWGLGVNPPQPGPQKAEKDGRSPAGIFRLGLIMGIEPTLPPGSKWTNYHHLSRLDAWPDDPTLPEYNQIFSLQPGQTAPAWFAKEQMKVQDPAYHWLVVIEHNYPHPIPGRGSAIFMHTRRGEDVPSAGCTTMERATLEKIITWLDPSAEPEFVLLTRANYHRFWKDWDLPAPWS